MRTEGKARRRWIAGLVAFPVLFFVAWSTARRILAPPGGLSVGHAAPVPAARSLEREDFWTAIRDLDLTCAAGRAETDSRRAFVDALGRVVAGDSAAAIAAFRALLDAGEPRIREASRAALERLLQGSSRWRELGELVPGNLEARAYGEAPREIYEIPEEPVRLAARIGWLRIPRIPVRLEARSIASASTGSRSGKGSRISPSSSPTVSWAATSPTAAG